jgi:hypothetical protein
MCMWIVLDGYAPGDCDTDKIVTMLVHLTGAVYWTNCLLKGLGGEWALKLHSVDCDGCLERGCMRSCDSKVC